MKAAATPWATLLLLGLNLAAAAAATFAPDLVADGAFQPREPWSAALVGHAFVHLNLVHLLGNLVVLAAVGPFVEASVGAPRLVAVYLAGALAGAAAHAGLSFSVAAPLMGASGAVAAVLGYAAVRYLGARVPLAPGWNAPVGAVAALWLVLQAAGAFVRLGEPAGSAGGTAFWAHLGGFVAGVGAAAAFRAPHQASLGFGRATIAEMSGRSPAAALAAAREHLARHPDDPEAWRELAAAAADLHDVDAEAQARRWLLERGSPADVGAAIARLAALHRLTDLPALARLRLADQAAAGEAADLLRWSVANQIPEDPARPDALLALAEACGDAAQRARIAGELAERYPLHAAAAVARARGWTA